MAFMLLGGAITGSVVASESFAEKQEKIVEKKISELPKVDQKKMKTYLDMDKKLWKRMGKDEKREEYGKEIRSLILDIRKLQDRMQGKKEGEEKDKLKKELKKIVDTKSKLEKERAQYNLELLEETIEHLSKEYEMERKDYDKMNDLYAKIKGEAETEVAKKSKN